MTHILLISDTERVKRVFDCLDGTVAFRVTSAATLIQADQEISASAPDFTFVQSRISGFSGEILLRHLKKVLPSGAPVVLLAGDAREVELAQRNAELHLDLSLADDALAGGVRALIQAGVRQPAQRRGAARSAASWVPEGKGAAKSPAPAAPGKKPGAKTTPPEPVKEAAARRAPQPDSRAATLPTDAGSAEKVTAPAAFQWSLPQAVPAEHAPSPKTKTAQKTGTGRRTSGAEIASPPPAAQPSPETRPAVQGTQPATAAGPDAETPLPMGRPLAQALLHEEKKKRPMWLYLFLLALIGIPAVSYLAGRQAAPPELALAPRAASRPPLGADKVPVQTSTPAAPVAADTAPVKAATQAAPASSAVPSSSAVPAPRAAPAARPAPAATAAPAAPVAGPAAAEPKRESVAKGGVPALPQVVTQAKLDAAYEKSHPGWQRYLGSGVEFKAFKEGQRYRALQVLSREGKPLPDQLLNRLLREFGGVDTYVVVSSGQKGQYLVEQGTTKSEVAVMLYRSGDRRMKAFVLYYR